TGRDEHRVPLFSPGRKIPYSKQVRYHVRTCRNRLEIGRSKDSIRGTEHRARDKNGRRMERVLCLRVSEFRVVFRLAEGDPVVLFIEEIERHGNTSYA